MYVLRPGGWRDRADNVLRRVYDAAALEDRKPTPKEIFDAYPFGMRKYEPYKIWLEQKKRWARGLPLRKRPVEKAPEPLPGQESLL